MKTRFAILPIFLLFATFLFSQQEFISGRLIDAKTKEPVVFATIKSKAKALGVISNMDGGFKIPLELKSYGDTLEISSMGYMTKSVLFSSLNLNRLNLVTIEPAIENLEEVVVRGKQRIGELSAEEIVRMAISRIPENHPLEPYSYVGYYRDYQLNQNQYSNLNEAIIEVFDQGFDATDYKTSKARIYDYKRNFEFPRDTIAEKPYDYRNKTKIIEVAVLRHHGGNEFTILRVHDAIRNHKVNSYDFVNRLNIDFEKNHTFKLDPTTFLGDSKMYTIDFFRDEEGGINAEGRLFISKENFAIHKFKYSISHIKGSNRGLSKTLKRKKFFEINTAYAPLKDKMYLNYNSVNNVFQVRRPPIFTLKSFRVNLKNKYYELDFSRLPRGLKAQKSGTYKIRYKGKRLKFEKLTVDGTRVLMYPEMKLGSINIEVFFSDKNDIDPENFDIRIKRLVDEEGNVFNESEISEVNQYREFFVQQVKPSMRAPKDTLFMNKKLPIFIDQPIVAPDNFSDYWMNTPLKSSE